MQRDGWMALQTAVAHLCRRDGVQVLLQMVVHRWVVQVLQSGPHLHRKAGREHAWGSKVRGCAKERALDRAGSGGSLPWLRGPGSNGGHLWRVGLHGAALIADAHGHDSAGERQAQSRRSSGRCGRVWRADGPRAADERARPGRQEAPAPCFNVGACGKPAAGLQGRRCTHPALGLRLTVGFRKLHQVDVPCS